MDRALWKALTFGERYGHVTAGEALVREGTPKSKPSEFDEGWWQEDQKYEHGDEPECETEEEENEDGL